jgi:hypothetical protein
MFDNFINHEELGGLLRGTVEENDVGVTFHEALNLHGEINDGIVAIFKIDSFYSSNVMPNPPPSVDYLVIVRCEHNGGYDAYIIELRNVSSTSGIRPREIRKKFATVFDDFFDRFSCEFGEIFDNLNSLRLYLISDPLGLAGKNYADDEIARRIKDTVIESYGFLTPFEFRGRAYSIEVVVPNPVIQAC